MHKLSNSLDIYLTYWSYKSINNELINPTFSQILVCQVHFFHFPLSLSLSLCAPAPQAKEVESFNGVVGGGAKIFDFDVERVEVGDEGILQGAPEGVRSDHDLEGLSCRSGCGGLNHGVERR